MTKSIPLTKGKIALVDDEDFEKINQHKWHYQSAGYAARRTSRLLGKTFMILMHREIMQTPRGMDTDHINGDCLDNRRDNLRICSTIENTRYKRIASNNTSGFKGVSFSKNIMKWEAYITPDHKKRNIGYFSTPEDAARAYDAEARKHFGEFARLNFPDV